MNAALGQRNWIDFLIWTAIVFSVFIYLFNLSMKTKSFLKHLEEKERIKNLNEQELSEYLANRKNKLENIINKNTKFITFFTRHNWILLILTIFFMLMTLFSSYTDLQLNTSFNQRLNAISPYINDHEIKILKSKWALMKSKQDFINLNSYLENLAKREEIILPENLLFY